MDNVPTLSANNSASPQPPTPSRTHHSATKATVSHPLPPSTAPTLTLQTTPTPTTLPVPPEILEKLRPRILKVGEKVKILYEKRDGVPVAVTRLYFADGEGAVEYCYAKGEGSGYSVRKIVGGFLGGEGDGEGGVEGVRRIHGRYEGCFGLDSWS